MHALVPSARNLRADGLVDPVGIVDGRVRLTWAIDAELDVDAALVVLMASSSQALGSALAAAAREDGEAGGNASVRHELGHAQRELLVDLPESRVVFWRVGVVAAGLIHWSELGRIVRAPDFTEASSEWIAPAFIEARDRFETASVWFRREIEVTADDAELVVHLATPGVADVRVDGRAVSDRILAPGYADPASEIPAASISAGPISRGIHLVTIEVASGPYWVQPTKQRYSKISLHTHRPRLLAAIEVLRDGEQLLLVPSNTSFAAGRGATTATSWYGGEDFDAGLPEPWNGLGDVGVDVLGDASLHQLRWPSFPPIAVVERLVPQTVSSRDDGSRIIDFGINMAGLPEVSWDRHPVDRLIVIRPGESVSEEEVSQKSTGSPIYDSLRIPAGSRGSWKPRFAYHGFRYLQVEGVQDGGSLRIEALVVRASNARSGGFTSSDPFLSRLHSAVDRAVQGNMFSVFTDCPHREKLGWLEQLHLCFGALSRNFDVEAHLRDSSRHIRTSQLADGAIPNISPEFANFSGHGFLGDENAFRFDVNWGGAIVLLPVAHYREYGDRRILHENASAMKRYLAHLASREEDSLIDFGLGDWIALDHSTPRTLIASYGYLRVLRAARDAADELSDHKWSAELDKRIRGLDARLAAWVLSDVPSQTELTLLVELAHQRGDRASEARLAGALIERIESDGGCFTVGEVAFEPLVNALHRTGRSELVNEIIRRPDVPGYGMQLAKGMTALAETWSADGGPEGEGSRNHFMLGMIDHWLHEGVAGLKQAPESIGWRRALVDPIYLAGVNAASSHFDSPLGKYSSAWRRSGRSIVLEVCVPFGGCAQVIAGDRVLEVTGGQHSYVVEES